MPYGSGRVQLSFAEEEPDVVDLTGGTVGTTTISGLSSLTASKYAGQKMRSIGPGTSSTKEWNVQDNTTTVITIEEATLTSDGLANTDDVSIEIAGNFLTLSTITGYIGHYEDDQDLPDPKMVNEMVHAHGGGQDPIAHITKRWEMHAPFKFLVQDWRFIFLAFGEEIVTGTDVGSGGGSTTSAANGTGIGRKIFDLASGTGYLANDYIQVGVANAEIRKITNVATNTLTVDHGFRVSHANAETCNEVTAPYTHTITCADRLPTFNIAGCFDEVTDFNRVYTGGKVNKLTLRSSKDSLLEATVEGWHQDAAKVSGTKPTVTVNTTDPYHFRMVDGGIVVNGVTYARVNSFEYTLNRNLKEMYYHCDLSANKPFEHIEGARNHELKVSLTVTNTNLFDLLIARTPVTITINFDRTATTDEFTMTWKNCVLDEGPHGLPKEGAVTVDLVFHPYTSGANEAVSVQVIDSNPYLGFI